MSNICRELSKQDYTTDHYYTESINVGSFQRIADACEKMAQSYTKLIDERDLYLKWYEEQIERNNKLRYRIGSLKGVITKLNKNKTNY